MLESDLKVLVIAFLPHAYDGVTTPLAIRKCVLKI